MYTVVFLRHGESTWNKENKFTGWTDVPLSSKGAKEARKAGITLKKEGHGFDVAFTSVLRRANDTLDLALKEMKLRIPVQKSWRLNERHYGALQGLNKAEMAAKYGEAQVKIWRRSYDTRPPALKKSDKRHPMHNALFKSIPKKNLPSTECLKDVVARVLPYWRREIAPAVRSGKRVIVAAHGNSLRALVKYLDDVPEDEITELNIPTGMPLVYDLDEKLRPIRHYYLGDPKEVKKAMEKVASQGKAK